MSNSPASRWSLARVIIIISQIGCSWLVYLKLGKHFSARMSSDVFLDTQKLKKLGVRHATFNMTTQINWNKTTLIILPYSYKSQTLEQSYWNMFFKIFKMKRNFAIRQVFAKGTELVTFCNTFSFLGYKIGYHDKLTTYTVLQMFRQFCLFMM